MPLDALRLHASLKLFFCNGKSSGQLKFPGRIGPKRPAAPHCHQRYGPEDVGKMLVPTSYPFAFYAHARKS